MTATPFLSKKWPLEIHSSLRHHLREEGPFIPIIYFTFTFHHSHTCISRRKMIFCKVFSHHISFVGRYRIISERESLNLHILIYYEKQNRKMLIYFTRSSFVGTFKQKCVHREHMIENMYYLKKKKKEPDKHMRLVLIIKNGTRMWEDINIL